MDSIQCVIDAGAVGATPSNINAVSLFSPGSHDFSFWGNDTTGSQFCCAFDQVAEVGLIAIQGSLTNKDTIQAFDSGTSKQLTNLLPPGGGPDTFLVVDFRGMGGADIIVGTPHNQCILTLTGDAGADVIDTQATFGSNVSMGTGNDTLIGGPGPDFATGGPGTDILDGKAGDDSLFGCFSTPPCSGPDGPDTILGKANVDFLFGDEGADDIRGGTGGDTIFGDIDGDNLRGGDGPDTIDGGRGNDFIFGEGGIDTLLGSCDDDELNGGSEDDFLRGGARQDKLFGGSGNDTLCDGPGPGDVLEGNDGDDILWIDSVASNQPQIIDGGADVDTCGHSTWSAVFLQCENPPINVQPAGCPVDTSVCP